MPRKPVSRPRMRKYRDLPENLSYDSARGLYRYRNPITKRRTYLSGDKKACVKAAKKLNAHLMPASADLITRVTGGGQTWTMAVYRYEQDIAPIKDWGDKTRAQYMTYLRKLRGVRMGAMGLADIEVIHVNQALDELTDGRRMRNVYRERMIQVFAYARNLGWCHDNPAEVTLKVSEKRRRMRLTMDGYRAVYAQAEPWLQVAMDLVLVTLQRPEDLIQARYSDIADGCLYIRQRKTGTKLRIGIGNELARVIDASRDNRVCPFILHRRPKRTRKSKNKKHPMQLTVDQLGKEFAMARSASGHYNSAQKPPPFYEIKSLGGDRYRSMGWTEEQIQALYGHEEMATTERYLAGHEPPWEDVRAG